MILFKIIAVTMTRTMIVVNAFTSGVIPDLFIDRMRTGSVDCLAPASMLLITTSSKDIVKDRNAALITPGKMVGSVTRRNVCTRFAPMERSKPIASLSALLNPSRSPTVTGKNVDITSDLVIKELENNNRSRSSKLRIIERIK